jgi:hypothetical protein
MLRAVVVLVAIGALAAPGAAMGATLVKVGDFSAPVYVTAPPGDPHRLFVVEKGGTIEVLHDGVRSEFIDLSAGVRADGEAGLLSMAFAPDYAASGVFYVFFTSPRPGDSGGGIVNVAELRRSAADPDRADPATLRPVLTVQHPDFNNHYGGQLQFGPDGLLYVSTGDGGSGGDPANNGQNTHALLGKLLRIDPRPDGSSPYTIPASNPFADGAGGAPEVYAWGLRNPWRFSFDRERGDLALGDVGEGTREEIDFAPRGTDVGADYGWRCREGTIPVGAPCDPSASYVEPVFEYGHTAGRCSVTGGYVVRNRDLDSLYGRYLYGDFCDGQIRSLLLAKPRASDDAPTGLTVASLSSFGEDSCGHVYAASLGGEVHVLLDGAFTPCPEPPPPPGGAPAPGGDPPPPVPPVLDKRAPRLELSAARVQPLRRRAVRVTARCDERCGVVASGRLHVPSAVRSFGLDRAGRTLAPGRRGRLGMGIRPVSARVAALALRRGNRTWATVRVVARDAAGNRSVRTRRVALKG